MAYELEQLQRFFISSLEQILTDLDVALIDEILDDRDFTSFSQSWEDAFGHIEEKKFTVDEKNNIDKTRQEVFMMTFSKTNSSDLSAYISEDFELIASHLLANTNNTWVTSLCATYFEKKIPQGELISIKTSLKEFILVWAKS